MRPNAEAAIDTPLVRALIASQHPDLADLELRDAGEGWDTRLFRLGPALAVRLPRRAASAVSVDHEQRWLPSLASELPLPVPAPLRCGQPGSGFPWRWSITRWFDGGPASIAPLADHHAAAKTLGRFLRALHRPAPADAPRNPWRGIPLADRTALVVEHLRAARRQSDERDVLAVWDLALAAPPWPGPPVWLHGDLHPANLLVADGALSAVIDFVDLAAGDPATDLAVMWMLLAPQAWPVFQAAADTGIDAPSALWRRARAWALALGLAIVANCGDDPHMHALGSRTIDAALRS